MAEEIDYRKGSWLNNSDCFDGDPYHMVIFESNCFMNCANYIGLEGYAPVCKAFPKGIPPEIWLGKVSHDAPYPGDHGIQFEPKEALNDE